MVLAPINKLIRAVNERGWKGVLTQLYLIGDLKFGDLKGTDKHGNKYYENLDLPFGQHRWVEYSNIHNYDASMIPPEWHGWMHHVYDETPEEQTKLVFDTIATTKVTHAIYNTHIGLVSGPDGSNFEQHNVSQYRQRGYKVGSIMTNPEDKDEYYTQPGHPLNPKTDKGGRFQQLKGRNEWIPQEEK